MPNVLDHETLLTGKVTEEDCLRIQQALVEMPTGMFANDNSLQLIFDSGCSRTATAFREDFIDGMIAKLPNPVVMDGIVGGIKCQEAGTVRYEIQDDKGEIQVISTMAYLMPGLKVRLLSPHQ
jgi:hypothetical protein